MTMTRSGRPCRGEGCGPPPALVALFWVGLVVGSLAACDAIGPGNRPTVAGVQGATVASDCAFLPTKTTAEKIIAARPTLSDAAIAAQICAAVTSSKRGAVAGVAIEGVTTR